MFSRNISNVADWLHLGYNMLEILLILGGALLGGLLLNITPCVLPVLPLKVMQLIKLGQNSKLNIISFVLSYMAGIIVTFVLLGAILIAIKLLGGVALWGFQFQSPIVIISLAIITGLLGLKVLGALTWAGRKIKMLWRANKPPTFRISIFYRIMGYFQEKIILIKNKLPHFGSFLEGGLTSLLGSACCGPFISPAIGGAMALSKLMIVGAFTTAGIGMAFPYLFLVLFPNIIKKVPKMGPWIKIVQYIAGVGLIIASIWFMSAYLF